MDFDTEQLDAITGGDSEFEREVLSEFLNCSPNDVEHIRQAIAAHDSDALGRFAHALKGSSATIGAKSLAALAKELEMAGKEGRAGGAHATFGRLQQCFELTCAWIRERVSKAA